MPGKPDVNIADAGVLFDEWMARTAHAEPDKKLMTSADVDKRIAEHIDKKMGKVINTVLVGSIGVALSVGAGAWTLSVQIRDAVRSAAESDQRLDERSLWIQRQEHHNREQDRILRRLDPSYIPPDYRDLPR